MKTTIVIAVGSFISMFLIVGAMFVLYSVDPTAFTGAPPPADSLATVKVDSLGTSSNDSLAAAIALAAYKDSIAHAAPAAIPVKKPEPVVAVTPAPAPPPADSTDWKSRAKFFDAMSIETATNILRTMNDKEVKQIIPYIKKRNAAKILALFEPDRAARIIR